jgi:hypothetical protein
MEGLQAVCRDRRSLCRLRAAGTVLSITVLALLGWAVHRVCNEPMDLSGTSSVPAWLSTFKQRDEIAFPVHAALGNVLSALDCDPLVSGLQWLKAAAHARSPAEIALTSSGLQNAAQRLGSSQALADRLCRFVARGYAGANQREVAEQAGVVCISP